MIETGKFLQQRYRIDKQIGQGGMGAVYVATDERFGSTVAIKETLCMDTNFRKAIEREARLLNSLKHSALPRVSDHFEEDDSQFLVMEYIAGEDVASILEHEQKAFPVDKVLKWADELLDALDYLHNQDNPVIHRDIKPQNLKITPRGQIILLDFGLAKGNPTDAGHQTAAKSIFGYSRNYASLEQIQGTGTDPRSDLYSLAATLYHLATNRAPEDALTRAMSVLSNRPDPLQPASSVEPSVPRGVAGVLQKALDLNANERPASADEMRQMLRESDRYAYLADAVTLAGLHGKQVLAQPTRLMPDGAQTDVKTEVIPAYNSDPTSVAASPAAPTNVAAANFTSAQTKKRRGVSVAAGAAIFLLVAIAIPAAIYIADPSLFGTGGDDALTTETALPGDADANTAASEPNSAGAEFSGTAETTRRPETTDRPGDAPKNKPAPPDTQAQSDDAPPDPGVDQDPNEIIVTRPDGTRMRIMKNGQRVPVPEQPPNMYQPFPRGLDPSQMTPQQRRRWQQMMRDRRAVPPANANRPKY
jgi:serine/threonine protein kinase